MNHDTNNDVARLREQNQNIRDAYLASLERDDFLTQEVEKLRELLERAIEAAENAIRLADMDYENDKFGKVTALKEELKELSRIATAPEEPAPKWRELGPDEVICEGDEYFASGIWLKVKTSIGKTPFDRELVIRTRRPLPKQEEIPLEKELERLKERDWSADPIPDITNCLRYLRDEIQKLKQK
jgi:hypothetical protein